MKYEELIDDTEMLTTQETYDDLAYILKHVGWCEDIIAVEARDKAMQEWCLANVGVQVFNGVSFEEADWMVVCQNSRTFHECFFAFRHPKDAVLFKMTWC